MKLLIVDDNPHIRQLIMAVLAPLAPAIVECADGADVLVAYETHRPDAVLMDIAMPGVDGIAATSAIVALHPSARVITVTNYDEPDLREAARRAGACGYVLKANLLELLPVVGALGREDVRPEPRPTQAASPVEPDRT